MLLGSLFSGAGIGDFGWEQSGLDIVWQVEKDKYCQRILDLRFPKTKKYYDIRDVTNLESVDIIAGGFPCQDISIAGKGKGIEGKHSSLWKEMLRICTEIKPKFIVIENVSRITSKGLSVVLEDIAKIRYNAEWCCFRASDFYIPHRRERLFLVAYPSCNNSGRIFDGEHEIQIHKKWNTTKNIRKWEGWKRWFIQTLQDGYWKKDSSFHIRGDDGSSSRVDRIKAIGNGQVAQITKFIGGLLLKSEGESMNNEIKETICPIHNSSKCYCDPRPWI